MAEVNTSVEEKLPIASSDDNIDFFWRKWLTVFWMPWTVPFQPDMYQSSRPHIGLPMTSRGTSPGESVCSERLNTPTPRTMHVSWYKRIRNSIITKIRVAKKSFFEKLSHPMASNWKFWSIIRSVNPSKSLSAVFSLMAQSQSMVSRTKPISLISILLPVLTRHLFHLLFHIC